MVEIEWIPADRKPQNAQAWADAIAPYYVTGVAAKVRIDWQPEGSRVYAATIQPTAKAFKSGDTFADDSAEKTRAEVTQLLRAAGLPVL